MSQTARSEILRAVESIRSEFKSNVVYVPALYCKEVTDLLLASKFELRYYDFPYISQPLLDQAEKLNAVVITVIYPPPYQICLSKIAKRIYSKEIFDCILVNPKFRDKYLKYFHKNTSIWSLRKFYGISYAFQHPQYRANSVPVYLRLKFRLLYFITIIRRLVIGRKIEIKIQNLIEVLKKYFSFKKVTLTPLSQTSETFYDICFIDDMQSHYSKNANSSEFWFEFSENLSDGSAWPGANNCLSKTDMKSYKLASNVNSKMVARYTLYRDQK